MPDDQDKLKRAEAIRMAWRSWLLGFIPLVSASIVAMYWFGFVAIFSLVIGAAVVSILYQRFGKKRTWHSIMWGDYASDK